jgi:hypothetical protein
MTWAATNPVMVQSNARTTIGSLAFVQNVTSGNLIVVSLYTFSGSVNAATVTDTLGTTFALAADQTGSNNLAIYYGAATGSGADTIAVSGTSGSFDGMAIHEFYGLQAVVDATAKTYGGSNPVSINVVTTVANDYIYAAIAGFHNTMRYSESNNGYTLFTTVDGNDNLASEGKLAGAAGTYAASMTTTFGSTGDQPFIAVAFKTSSVTAPTPIKIVQQAQCVQASGTATTCAFPSSVTSGNLIIISCSNGHSASGDNCSSPSDSLSTSFTQAIALDLNNSDYASVYFGPATAGGADTISSAYALGGQITILEVNGLSSVAVDTIGHINALNVSTISGPILTSTQNNSIYICQIATNSATNTKTFTQTPLWTTSVPVFGLYVLGGLQNTGTSATSIVSVPSGSTASCTMTNTSVTFQGSVGVMLKGTVASTSTRRMSQVY